MNSENLVITHPWQEAGLGQAPFQFVGMTENMIKHADGSVQPGGCCQYCFNGIRYEMIIKSHDGKTFVVGSDCVKRVGSHTLTTAAELAKKQHLRAKKEEARRLAHEQKLEAQRLQNGGLTDYELAVQQREERETQEKEQRAKIAEKWADEVKRLQDGKNGFRDSVADSLAKGYLPTGRGLSITLDILSKQMGRSGSKKYEAEYERLEALFVNN